MKTKTPRPTFKTAHQLIQELRIGLGLPITAVSFKPPLGYFYHPDCKKVLLPDTKVLRTLYKAIKAKDKGYSFEVLARWFKRNAGIKVHPRTLQRIYHTRPILAEIELPLDERRKIYEAALQKAKEDAEIPYEAYLRARAWGRPKGNRAKQRQSTESSDETQETEKGREDSGDWSGYCI